MAKYQFTVKGLPPKKDGANSVWNKPSETNRLVELRVAALEAMQGEPAIRNNIKLALKIHIGPVNDRSVGDLDAFVTGVCDGLMAADRGAKLDSIWDNILTDVYPTKAIAILDGSQIVIVHAEKIIGGTDQPWYAVILEEE